MRPEALRFGQLQAWEKTMFKVNGVEITAKQFAYDGCHKIYLINYEEDRESAEECGYTVFPIEGLHDAYDSSCGLRFISNWDLTGHVVGQFEDAKFEGFGAEPVNAE
jgi:hypothetical protein